MPYITGGLPGWQDAVRAVAAAGADAIEIGLPFSDPVMDGPVIQLASQMALEAGATPVSILDEARELDVGIPLAVMTLLQHRPPRRPRTVRASARRGRHRRRAACPICRWRNPARGARPPTQAGIETVMFAAPTAPDERLPRIVARARGFVYSVGLLGVTGERDQLASTAASLARRLKAITDVPVLIGVGVSNAAQARQAVQVADGVVMGASVIRRLLDDGPDAAGDYIAEVRAAIDA